MPTFKPNKPYLYCLLICLLTSCASPVKTDTLPAGFVYADDVITGIKIDLRYYGKHNFVGKRIAGYLKPRCIMTLQAANALQKVQQELRVFNLSLKIYDAYRPQQAVDNFVSWAEDLSQQSTKQEFYPNVAKQDLFKQGYIAAHSSHSRGSTVDVSITSLSAPAQQDVIDMGSAFDYFGPESWPTYPGITAAQRAHRMLLNNLMLKHGFKPYPKEWWHFTLAHEPFPNSYFNFPVQ